MKFALPSGVVNTDSAYYYPDDTMTLGPLVKEPNDQTLIIIDYSQLTPSHIVGGYDFLLDVTSNPALVVSYPQVNAEQDILTFLVSGGIVGQQYNLTVRTTIDINQRLDVLTINIPSSADCCERINPVPTIYSQLPLGDPTQGYVNTGVRYFWGSAPPNAPNVMDQWYSPDTGVLSEWVTDGTQYRWQVLMNEGLVEEAPADDILYGRYNGYWVRTPIQSDAPEDDTPYARFMGAWQPIPPIIGDAPADDGYYTRRNNAWIEDPNSSLPTTTKPLMDGVAAVGTDPNFARGDHVHPTDTSLYPASNPAGYTTAAQVAAALAPYAPITSVPVASNVAPQMNGTATPGGSVAFSRADHVHPSDLSRLPLAGGTMTGTLILAADPLGNMTAATKQYVDNAIIDCGTY